MGYWPIVLNVLRNSDVVLLLVDARMPELSQNSEIVSKVESMKEKRLIVVFNKCDLISKTELKKLEKEYPNAYFVSSTKKKNVEKLKRHLVNLSENFDRFSLRVGLVGYPNVGKSSLINLLAPTAKAKVSSVSGTTKKTQWVRDKKLRIMDSPGIIPFGDSKTKLGMTASKDPHKIKNPENIAIKIINYLRTKESKALLNFYSVGNLKSEDDYEIFEAIARKKGYLIKGGEVDEHRTAIQIIDDWQKGKIKLG
ncbi:GTPase RsgA [archaeon]|jgi:ribosome biogenesis GTPase A|nr:GTPase RsgA [archaeon]MBT6182699.1 GTPase RsgA [archaeon]MBT6606704.1 GTPase RsgA [archaeon]MBT7251947.1 GTPase RsgA [archaeon]MBT7660652.1 GTPase RsgA [archaeon]